MMKTSVRIVAVVMALLLVTLALASCSGLSGTYAAEAVDGTGVYYTFAGKNVTIVTKALGIKTGEYKGTYKIDGDEITITIDGKDDSYSGTFDFEKTDKGIKIGIIEYEKQ